MLLGHMAGAANLINTGGPGVRRTTEDRLRQDIPTGPASPSHVPNLACTAKKGPSTTDSDGQSSGESGEGVLLVTR